ncbi:MAG: TrpR-like protein YerC/YecD [Coriobacteriales bacterium]|jgi:TrpR-related protein YerC/YecD|nr:TrpR-like protein YerC/YecD [Coriobacteriales bacterium]
MTSNKRTTSDELDLLYQALASTNDARDIALLLEDLCTIREVNEMAQRLTVARLLLDSLPYTAISEQTGASATTIARVSKALYHGAGGYSTVFDRLQGQRGAPLPRPEAG